MAFFLLLATMVATAALNWQQVGVADRAADTALSKARVLRAVDGMMASMIDQETGLRGYLLSTDTAFLDPYVSGQAKLADFVAKLKIEWAQVPDQLSRLDTFLAVSTAWRRDVAEPEIGFMKDPATRDQARKMESSGAGKSDMDKMRSTVTEMVTVAQSRMDAANNAQDNAVKTSYTTLIVASLTSFLVALSSVTGLMLTIACPIRAMTSFMERLAGGDTIGEIPGRRRGDEIGAMAATVEIFRQSAISNRRLEDEAEANRLQAESERVRVTAEAESAAQKRLQEATSGLASGLKRLAAGDLAFRLDETFAPDFEALRHDLNDAVGQLSQTLRSVATATNAIDGGSREISNSAEDLSRRTEQQAAALEETAAALDEITANVSNSSKRAEEARAIAVQANASAADSGRVVANAVDAMQKIEQSSNQVSNIISVIDEIAFQTNLLALNAGVEAARAGDAGKGFAVVAQEVRELAQRSAKAAKEIKELIRNSSVEVQNGVKLVSDTGDALKTIEKYIVTVNQHMDAIATSAREQSIGLAEVNTAVNQMDQVTQQNAAMVEESTAASAALASESNSLRELINRFTLGQSSPVSESSFRDPASPTAAHSASRPVVSPARRLAGKVAQAFGASAAAKDSWEEF